MNITEVVFLLMCLYILVRDRDGDTPKKKKFKTRHSKGLLRETIGYFFTEKIE